MTDYDKAEVYEFMGRYFVARDGEVFEMTDNGMVRLCDDFSEPQETVLFYRPALWFANTVPALSPNQKE